MATTENLVPKGADRLMCVKIGKEKRENLYEMTRKYWRADMKRARLATHVLAIKDGIVIGVFHADKWVYTDNPQYEGRLEFIGKEDPASDYVGKSVASFYGQSQNPVKYINM